MPEDERDEFEIRVFLDALDQKGTNINARAGRGLTAMFGYRCFSVAVKKQAGLS